MIRRLRRALGHRLHQGAFSAGYSAGYDDALEYARDSVTRAVLNDPEDNPTSWAKTALETIDELAR